MLKSEFKVLSPQLLPGDVLLIAPPVARADNPLLSLHLLQACCQRAGITARVFYANLHFSSLIGFDLYHTLTVFNTVHFIGERLFAAAAFGLPSMGRNVHRLIEPDWLPDHLWQRKNEIQWRKVSETLTPFRKWVLSQEWQQVEKQAAQWTQSVAQLIARMDYPVVGCSNTLGGLVPGIALLHHVKKANPNIITVLGGALCEGEMAEGILSLDAGIDHVFSGESDTTFPAFVRDVLDGKGTKEKIIYGKEVMDLDELPVPDYQEFFRQVEDFSLKLSSRISFSNPYLKLSTEKNIPIPYETSRGCRWKKCTFCAFNGTKNSYRFKSSGKVIRDLEQLTNRHSTNPIAMADNLMPSKYLDVLFPRISKKFTNLDIIYGVSTNLTLNQVITLEQAGIMCIIPGIESLSSSLCGKMRKMGTARQNIALLRYARSVGINVWWNLLYGIPGDQICEYKEMIELIPLIYHLPPPVSMVPIIITRFSLYHKYPEEFNIRSLRPAALYEDVLPAHVDLEKIAYYWASDFEVRSYEDPVIFDVLWKEYQSWLKAWKFYETNYFNPQIPMLHLERKSNFPGEFVLRDTRGLPGKPEIMVVDREKADVLLVARPWKDSPQLLWAVDAQLAVRRESWFIPLATAEPELFREFEDGME